MILVDSEQHQTTGMNPNCQLVGPVFQEYRDILARFIKSRVKDPVDGEELLSLVMMKIYDNCDKVKGIRNTEAWLITIARNTITDYFRDKQKRHSEELSMTLTMEEEENLTHQLGECVPSLIDKLPEKYAAPLAAYELKGIPQKQLAVQFNMSESGLKSRIQRGRKMLKELFTDYCGHLILDHGCDECSC